MCSWWIISCGVGRLNETGILVLKEMSTDSNGGDMYDVEDSSVTRTDEKFRKFFKETGMNVISSEIQGGIPKTMNLLPIRMYALRPMS